MSTNQHKRGIRLRLAQAQIGPPPKIETRERLVMRITRRIHSLERRLKANLRERAEMRAELKGQRRGLRIALLAEDPTITLEPEDS